MTDSPTAPERPRVVRLSVNLAPDVAEQVRAMADRAGVSYTEATRRAFSLLALVQKAEADGATIIRRKAGEPDRELRLRP